jgi:hypothetical protein
VKRRQDLRYVPVRCPECDRRSELIAPIQPGRWVHQTPDGIYCPATTAVPDHDRGDR